MEIRKIKAQTVCDTVKKLFTDCNYFIGKDIMCALETARDNESSPVGESVLSQIIENDKIAAREEVPLCQDTGMAVLFVEYGDKVVIEDGSFDEAVNEGVRRAYIDGYLRKSVVSDPVFDRINTKDNTPMVVGVGIGGTFERAAQLAKKATFRPIDSKNEDERYAQLEDELLAEINKMGFGPAGLGGNTTAIGVNIETSPTHIAGMPVAVNICCHAARHASATI